MFNEALSLVAALNNDLLLVNSDVLSLLTTAEECTPNEDCDVSGNHTDNAGCDTNRYADKNWDKDVQDNATNESTKGMLVVMSVRTVSVMLVMRARTAVSV